MKIVGCDLHARQQTVAMVDTETGEFTEKARSQEGNAVREFYGALEGPVVVGIEATGAMQWCLEWLEELRIECRVGPPAKIRAAETRKQKHDRRDARWVLDLLVREDRFPQIGMPSTEPRDVRTLLRDRHPWVKMGARWPHSLPAIALDHALRHGPALWSAAGQSARRARPLPPYTGPRRNELWGWYAQLPKRIQGLDQEVEGQARPRPPARRLLTHPGVGPVTALATELFLGDPKRFATGHQVASYSGMIPCEHSSGQRQRRVIEFGRQSQGLNVYEPPDRKRERTGKSLTWAISLILQSLVEAERPEKRRIRRSVLGPLLPHARRGV